MAAFALRLRRLGSSWVETAHSLADSRTRHYDCIVAMALKHSHLIYDWNTVPGAQFKPAGQVLLNDESLRDGLQSPSVRDPSIEEKIEILHLMEALGINSLDLGLPGAGKRASDHVEALAREIVRKKMKIRANCAARTHENDIR